MGPSSQDGGRAADIWIGTVTQRVGRGPSQASHANQGADDERVEILTQQWLVFVTAHEQAGAVGIGRAAQHA